jgi:deoxyribonuclease V
MKLPAIPLWPDTAEEALSLQNELRHRVRLVDDFETPHTVAGIDCSYDTAHNLGFAVIVLLEWESLQSIASVNAALPVKFPYIPGLLSFREIPVILEALERLPQLPDLLMVDGQGIAHPRRLGIAAHLGVLTDMPAIGVAKSRLTGRYTEPGPNKGDTSPLMDRSERIGTVLRSKEKTNPLFISAGHRITQERALEYTLRCLTRYRLPEPTRLADKLSKQKDKLAKI